VESEGRTGVFVVPRLALRKMLFLSSFDADSDSDFRLEFREVRMAQTANTAGTKERFPCCWALHEYISWTI
jgi:hypothetical protein